MRPIKTSGMARKVLFRIGNLEVSYWKRYEWKFRAGSLQSINKEYQDG